MEFLGFSGNKVTMDDALVTGRSYNELTDIRKRFAPI